MNVFERLKAGISAHQRGQIEIAAEAYREVLAVEPENADALHFFGMLHHQTGDTENAIALIRKSLAVNPNNPSAHNNLGNVLLSDGRPVEAAEAYGEAINLDPNQPESHQNLGVLLRRLGKLKEAADMLRQAVELAPKNPEAWHNLAICLMMDGNFDGAADALESCVNAGITDRLNPVWHARILCSMGREQKALEHLERHLARDPDDPVARHHAAAIRGEHLEKVPDDYVREHFDAFARSFDDTLRGLEYRAPQVVAEEVSAWRADGPPGQIAIDLGCGTGLCGPLITKHCERLIGVDLSPQMLYRAATVGAYHELHEAELVGFLASLPGAHVDLAVSADTLNYLGALEPLMHEVMRVLKPGAALVATFEEHSANAAESDARGYRLRSHGRYSHTPAYLVEVTRGAGLEFAREHRAVLRREANEDVSGLVATIVRPR